MPSEPIVSVGRALAVLSSFDAENATTSLAGLAQRTRLHKTTLLRILVSLENAGFVRRLEDGTYRLGPELMRLGNLYLDSFALVDHVRPALAHLTRETGESSAFYISEDDTRVCLCRCESKHSIRHHVAEGQRLPINRGTAGRVLQAFDGAEGEIFDHIRLRKVIALTSDRVPEVSAVCCPVFGPGEVLAGALQVSGPTVRFEKDLVTRIEFLVIDHARKITRAIGGNTTLLNSEEIADA